MTRIGPQRGRVALLAAILVAMVGAATACSSGSSPSTGTSSPPSSATVAGLRVAQHLGSGVELVSRTKAELPATSAAGPVASAEQDFSLALLHQLASSSGENTSVSPASLAIALSMLQNGASGATRSQISAALQADGIDVPAQDAGWAALAAAWRDAAKSGGFTLQSANSLWTQSGLPLRKPFMSDLARYFRTGVWQVDYAHHLDDAVSAINRWTDRNTHGKIPKLFDQLDPSTALVLANAVYFKADWQYPFDPSDTEPGAFTLADGSTAQAKFMSEDMVSLPASVSHDYTAVQLPYRGGRFAALAIMPNSGSLADFTQSLSTTTLASIVHGLRSQDVSLRMPRFTTASTLDLGAALRSLGMTDAFSNGADFSALSPTPLQVSQVVQRVYLSVGEKGTVAAAATGIGIIAGAVPAQQTEISLDHPFLFLIRDTTTGAILFASQIEQPRS